MGYLFGISEEISERWSLMTKNLGSGRNKTTETVPYENEELVMNYWD